MADDDTINFDENEDFDAPVHDGEGQPETPRTPKTPRTPTDRNEGIDPEAALRRELDGVRHINEVIESVLQTLDRAGGNMDTVSKTVNNASTLLNSWTRILSQTEHNQRLILHPSWKGATEDLAEQEAEALQRQQEAERRAAEEERRREDTKRKREEEEEKRRLGETGPTRTRSTRVVRGTRARGTTTSTRGASSGYGQQTRGASNIGRGFGAARTTRARGTRGGT